MNKLAAGVNVGSNWGGFRTEEEEREREVKRKELGSKHDLVIVPIFFKRDFDMTNKLFARSKEIKQRLIDEFKLNVWVDQRTSLTPGQKFGYWEAMGTKWRVEFGPSEFQKGTMILAHANNEGQQAQRFKDITLDECCGVLTERGNFAWLNNDDEKGGE